MHHRAVIKLGTHDNNPYNIQCSCGTGGDFGGKQEAMDWMMLNHFRFLQGISTVEFVDETPKIAEPELVTSAVEEEIHENLGDA